MPNPPAREFVQLDSTLETLRAVVAGTADLPGGARVFVRTETWNATRHGSTLSALVIVAHADEVAP